MRTANDVLLERGHTNDGRCDQCWRDAAAMYAGGQGAYESHVDAYYAAMKRAEEEAVSDVEGDEQVGRPTGEPEGERSDG